MTDKLNLKIYEASAGSGKTTKLATEYITQLFKSFKPLIKNHSPEKFYTDKNLEEFRKTLGSILAVTFTNRASEQMGKRILDYLYKFSDNDDNDVIKKVLNEVSHSSEVKLEDIKKWSPFFLDFIITCYSDFKVTTIDSFSATLFKVLSPDVEGIPPDFEIKVSYGESLKEKIKCFLEDKVRDNWQEISSSLEEVSAMEEKRNFNWDRMLTKKISRIFNKFKNLEKIDINKLEEDLNKPLDKIRKSSKPLSEFIERNEEGINKSKIQRIIRGNLKNLVGAEQKDLTNQATYFADKAICKNNADNLLKKEYQNLAQEFRPLLTDFQDAVKKSTFTINKLKIAHFANLAAEFSDVFLNRRKDFVYLEEIPNFLREKLKAEAMPYLYLKLSEKYLRFLIDEFQDTSSRQLEILVPIASNAILSGEDRSSIFIVGDQKQAIYFWRGVEMGMMKEEKIIESFDLQGALEGTAIKKNLEYNFRSDGKLVEFFNNFWKKENMTGLDLYALEDSFSEYFANAQQKPAHQKGGYVEIKRIGEDDQEKIYEEIYETVKRIKSKRWRDGDIAILLRENKNIKNLFEFLTEKGLECITDESTYLLSSPLVSQMISFMRFLDFPPDDLSFMEFARSGLLKKAAESMNIDYNWDDSLYFEAKKSFYTIFRGKFPEVWETFVQPFFNSVGFMTAYDVYEDILYRFCVERNFPGSSYFTIKLGEILHDLEVSNRTSISSFLSFISENDDSGDAEFKIDIPKDEEKIKILTIHSSKGLEFENVILDIFEGLPKRRDAIYELGGNLIKIKKETSRIDEVTSETYEKEIKKFNIGELNLLYVAMTRARHGLYMIGGKVEENENSKKNSEENIPKRISKFQDIVYANKYVEFEDNIFNSGEMPENASWAEKSGALELKVAAKRKSVNEIKDSYLVYESGEKRSDEQKRGDLIHSALSGLGVYKNKSGFENALSASLDIEVLNEDEKTLIKSFFLEESVMKYYVGDFSALNESEFISDEGEIRRPDRIVQMTDCVWIIDYKTGKEEESEHRKQLENYCRNLEKVYSGSKIKTCLLYLDKRELVYV